MLTQQDLINRLNQLTLRYNLTWFDVKYDADKAINKINGFMGTKYPKLTEKMTSPTDTYSFSTTIKVDGVDQTTEYEIIKEEYFHSVIIPYIAAEILARDEEFTTIYTKYVNEMQEGLFDMFQREFNSVPFEFRQNPGEGVFFGEDTALGIVQHNDRNLNIPTFKFLVKYFPNNNNIAITSTFPVDPKAYVYDEQATILFPPAAPNNIYYSNDGATVFTFAGWGRDHVNGLVAGSSYVEVPGVPTLVKMRADLNLYAFWTSSPVLTNTSSGIVSIQSAHRANLVNLVIPESVNGIKVITIPSAFISSNQPINDFLASVYLPTSVNTVSASAFNNFKGETIVLNEGLLSIGSSAFAETPNLKEIIIPSTVTTISSLAFPEVAGKYLVIKTRVLEINKPAGWAANWYAPSNPNNNYSVEIIWGYNGA